MIIETWLQTFSYFTFSSCKRAQTLHQNFVLMNSPVPFHWNRETLMIRFMIYINAGTPGGRTKLSRNFPSSTNISDTVLLNSLKLHFISTNHFTTLKCKARNVVIGIFPTTDHCVFKIISNSRKKCIDFNYSFCIYQLQLWSLYLEIFIVQTVILI